MADYESVRLKHGYEVSATCVCGHAIQAHGSAGKICCACDCKQFILYTPLRTTPNVPVGIALSNSTQLPDGTHLVEVLMSPKPKKIVEVKRISKFRCCTPGCTFLGNNFERHKQETGHQHSKAIYKTV